MDPRAGMCLGFWKEEVPYLKKSGEKYEEYTVKTKLILNDVHPATKWCADPNFRLTVDGVAIKGTFRSKGCSFIALNPETGEVAREQICLECATIPQDNQFRRRVQRRQERVDDEGHFDRDSSTRLSFAMSGLRAIETAQQS